MPGTLSTQKRARLAPPAPAAPVTPDWSSLPDAMAVDVCQCLLADNDIDGYMAFRSVCQKWRSDTAEEPEKADYADPSRFVPEKWTLLDRQDDLVTFVNVDTGRFLRKSIPLLRRYCFVGATGGGLVLLAERAAPHRARLLNPFTGSVAEFSVCLHREGVRAVAVTLEPLLVVFISTEDGDIMWADQDSLRFKRFSRMDDIKPTCMTYFDGSVHATDPHGSVFTSTHFTYDDDVPLPAGEERNQSFAARISMGLGVTIRGSPDPDAGSGRYFLVESGGNLLLVTRPSYLAPNQPLVRRVNVDEEKLEPIGSIGSNRAIFVSHVRCLSVDASKFHGIQGGCIYFVEPILTSGNYYQPSSITTYRVEGGRQGFIMFEECTLEGCFRPFTLAQVLADYCRSVYYSEVQQMIPCEWDWDFSQSESDSDETDVDLAALYEDYE